MGDEFRRIGDPERNVTCGDVLAWLDLTRRNDAADRGAETTLGNLPFAVTMLASLECSEAVKILLGRRQTLRGRLLIFDLTDLTFDMVQLAE